METARNRADRRWHMNLTDRVAHVLRTQAGPDGLVKVTLGTLAERAGLEHGATIYARNQLLRADRIDRLADSLYRVRRWPWYPSGSCATITGDRGDACS
jgi:hypothetical protein